jgi:hypothetical protein
MDPVKKLIGSMSIGELLKKGFTSLEIVKLYTILHGEEGVNK